MLESGLEFQLRKSGEGNIAGTDLGNRTTFLADVTGGANFSRTTQYLRTDRHHLIMQGRASINQEKQMDQQTLYGRKGRPKDAAKARTIY